MTDIALTAGIRSTVSGLQNISSAINRTQQRLSTGKKVNSALDNPTNFFASQANLNRADDLDFRKDGMSEAIQTGNAANAGITGIASLIQGAKGIASAAHLATDRGNLISQFNEILDQIDSLAGDSGYQGKNLLNNDDLTVNFNENGKSNLTIAGVDATTTGLGIARASLVTALSVGHDSSPDGIHAQYTTAKYSGPPVPYGGTFTMTIAIPSNVSLTPSSLSDQTNVFNGGHLVRDIGGFGWGNDILSVSGNSSAISITATNKTAWPGGTNPTINAGDQFVLQIFPGETLERTFKAGASPTSAVYVDGALQNSNYSINSIGDVVFNPGDAPGAGQSVTFGSSGGGSWGTDVGITNSEKQLEAAMNTLRSESSALSSNLGVVAVRQTFTQQMISTLETGSDNLTLANMNEEGANMLMLQTRQSLGTTSLSLGNQAAQSVMKLF